MVEHQELPFVISIVFMDGVGPGGGGERGRSTKTDHTIFEMISTGLKVILL